MDKWIGYLSGEVPGGIWSLIVTAVIVTYILVYFNRHTRALSRARFRGVIFGVLALLFCIYAAFWWRHRPLSDRRRIIIFPPTVAGDQAPSHIAWQTAEATIRALDAALDNDFAVYPLPWIWPVLQHDTLGATDYLLDFARFASAEICGHGELRQTDGVWTLSFEWLYVDRGATLGRMELNDLRFPESFLPQGVGELVVRPVLESLALEAQSNAGGWPSASEFTTFCQAAYLRGVGDLPAAATKLQPLLDDSTSFLPVYSLMGEIHIQMARDKHELHRKYDDNIESAGRLMKAAVKRDSTFSAGQRVLGYYHILREEWAGAEMRLFLAYELDPWDYKLHLLLARLHASRLESLGFNDEESVYRRAVFINPVSDKAQVQLAKWCFFTHHPDRAIEQLDRFLTISPDAVDALMFLGKILIHQGKIQRIVDVFTHIIDIDPTNALAFYNLGVYYYNSKDFDDAIPLFERAIKLENLPDAHLYLGYIHEQMGETEVAIEHLRARIRLKQGPDDKFADEAMKLLYELTH